MTKHELQDIKEGWQDDETADSYDDKRFSTLSGKLSDLLDKIAIKKGLSGINKNGRVLDLPCGTGRILHHLYSVGYKNITGADISEQMIHVAETRTQGGSSFSFVRTEAEHTEFTDKAFDAVISIRFMGHIPKDTRIEILREFNRICKGPIVVEYPIRNSLARRIKHLFGAFTVRARLPSQWEWHDVSHQELKDELQKAGLRITRLIAKLPYLSESVFVVAQRSGT